MSDSAALTLVLLPGMHGTATLFEPLRRHLPLDRAVCTIEYSNDPTVDYAGLTSAVRQVIPAGDSVILGESFAGPMAVELATSSANVRGLILASSFLRVPVAPLLTPVARSLGPAFLRRGLPTWAIRRYLLGNTAAPSLVASVVAEIQSIRPELLAARLDALMTVDVRTSFAALKVPKLLVAGEQDRLVPASFTDEAIRSRPDTDVLRFRDAPHLVLQTHASNAASALETFLRRLENRP